jgi:hypothetical protein
VKGRTHFDRLSLNEWILKAAPRCKQLGWPIANPKVVASTRGDVAAPSMIRPLNYYSYKNSQLYLRLANRDLSPSTALYNAVRENVDSLYFKVTP